MHSELDSGTFPEEFSPSLPGSSFELLTIIFFIDYFFFPKILTEFYSCSDKNNKKRINFTLLCLHVANYKLEVPRRKSSFGVVEVAERGGRTDVLFPTSLPGFQIRQWCSS